MNMDKFLTEIRKIIREEINIALDEVKRTTDKRIAEVLTKRLVESKSQKQTPTPVKKTSAAPTKSKSGLTSSDADLIRSVKSSISGKQPAGSNGLGKKLAPTPKSVLPPALTSLPTTLQEALAQTTMEIRSGISPGIIQDGAPSHMTDYVEQESYGSMMDMGGDAGFEEQDDFGSMHSFGVSNDVPDFLSSAIAKAGKVAKRAEEFSISRAGG